MCDRCGELVACPVGQKRKVNVDFPLKPEIVDFYGRVLYTKPTQIVIDKWPDGHVDCFIEQECYDENSVHYGFGMDISHCPFCGQKLR